MLLQGIRDATNGGYPLASEAFKATVLAPLGWKMEASKPGPRALSPEGIYAVDEFGVRARSRVCVRENKIGL